MRRAIARGRVFPQSFSTDRRYARCQIKTLALFPMLWANADDQGRFIGDPEEIKYSVCPGIDHITKTDIPTILQDLIDNKFINLYDAAGKKVLQLLDWWDTHQKMQWAWPSEYPAPNGWKDHLRYKKDTKTVVTENWPVSGETIDDVQVSTNTVSGEHTPKPPVSPLNNPPIIPRETGTETGEGKGKRNSPDRPDDKPPSSPDGISGSNKVTESDGGETEAVIKGIENTLVTCYRYDWGRVRPDAPDKIIPRELTPRDAAQLRDLAMEIFNKGGDKDMMMIKQAFGEAGMYQKFSISYVRKVLLEWMGVSTERPAHPSHAGSP